MPEIELSSFELESATFEFRYDEAYFIWDRAGYFWDEAASRWPGLKLRKAEPGITKFILKDKFEFGLNIDSGHVIQYWPESNLDEFMNVCSSFHELSVTLLEVGTLKRLGFRIKYFKKYKDKNQTSNEFTSLGLVKTLNGKHFNIEGSNLMPEYALRYEDEDIGVTGRVQAVGRTLEFEPPPNTRDLEAKKVETFGILYDIDYYTLSEVSVSQFRAKDWLGQVYRCIKRDSKVFLGGS